MAKNGKKKKKYCFITAKCSEDQRINSQEPLGYEITLLILYLPTCNSEPLVNTPNNTDERKQEQEYLDEEKDLLDGFFK